MLRPAARATAREGGNASQAGLQLLLAYLATNTKELRQLQCPDIAAPLRAGEARRGKPAIPFRASEECELRAWEAWLRVSREHAADAAQFAECTALPEWCAGFFRHCASRLYKPVLKHAQ